jgi:iron complex outermembrane receptor protein
MRSVLGLVLVVVLSIAVSFFTSLAFAQGGATGAITGTVQDPTASVLGGAGVKIISDATGGAVRQLTTDSSGAFTATLLPVGSYSVEVRAAGFATTKFSGIVVRLKYSF